ncbi:MAG TPA: fused MFS/spermidine synthase [Holophagaceae bacterium]|nr:fused MFS/spermidine synthase [Holophagaceae bacterium]
MPELTMTSEPEAEGLETAGTRALDLLHPAATIFLGAFLLFQVQPLLAKEILPWFGGTAAVWTVCMLFFQVVLLGGYLYAHALARRAPRTQAWVHGALLLLCLVTLPLAPNPAWRPTGGADPTLRILGLLATTVGLPYLVLASTSPLLQAWLARARPGYSPYRLFALSNFGSMLALLSYPLVVEPNLRLSIQGRGWSILFLVYAALAGALVWRVRDAAPAAEVEAEAGPAPTLALRSLWVGLAFVASLLLLAITSHLSTNVAPIPFLWVLPLALYLLSFILCFESHRWYRRAVFLPLLLAALGGMAWLLSPEHAHSGVRLQVAVFGGGLFVACMVAHGELARLRPHPSRLTGFYLSLSIGGALGGVMAGIVAPLVFRQLLELPLGLALLMGMVFLAWVRNPDLGPWPRRGVMLLLALATGGMAAVVVRYQTVMGRDSLVQERNFYGALRVREDGEGAMRVRLLLHGTINHGGQFLDAAKSRNPTGYYGPDSGVGLALRTLGERGPLKVGITGLGSGNLLGYARTGDTYRVYEINPQVEKLARTWFTMLPQCPARTEVVMGDARLNLERESPQGYDILIMDAFSSDSIPVHLLTREALELYRRHLKPGGILAVHISNRYLDLKPVLLAASKADHWPARWIEDDEDEEAGTYGTDWVLFSDDPSFFGAPLLKEAADPLEGRPMKPWTDDYSNLYRILK